MNIITALHAEMLKPDGYKSVVLDELADDRLVHFTAVAMAEKLEISRTKKGRGGWWDKDACSIEQLKSLLKEHVEKGDMIDVVNLSAMIYVREAMEGE